MSGLLHVGGVMGAKRIQPGSMGGSMEPLDDRVLLEVSRAKDRNMRKGKRKRACDTFNNKKGMVSLNSLSKVIFNCHMTTARA